MQNATVQTFCQILIGELTRHDEKLQKRQPNIYRLGIYLERAEEVKQTCADVLDKDDAPALGAFIEALKDCFVFNHDGNADLPPVARVVKKVETWLKDRALPSYC